MADMAVQLDLRGLPGDRQMAELRGRYMEARDASGPIQDRSERNLPVIEALVDDPPARLYVSLLEGGFRVALQRQRGTAVLRLWPEASTPRTAPGAHSIATHPDGRVYVTTTEDRVAVIDASSRRVSRYVPTGSAPQHLELSPNNDLLYVANGDSSDVSIIETSTDRPLARPVVGPRPMLPCVASDGRVYLPSGRAESVTILEADGRVIGALPVGQAPHDIGVSPDARWAYQPNSASHDLTIIDASRCSLVGRLAVGLAPGHVAFSADSRFAFVANTMSDDVSVVDMANHEVVRTIPAGAGAHLPMLSHDGRRGYVADFVSDDLAVWDAKEWRALGHVSTGVYPHAFAISPDDAWIVVSNTGESSVSVIETAGQRVVAKLPVGSAPGHVAFDPAGQCAFIACQLSNQVAVVDPGRQRVVDLIELNAAHERLGRLAE